MAQELGRIGRVIGREGRMTSARRSPASTARGPRASVRHSLVDDLARPTTEVGRVIEAVARVDLGRTMALPIEGQR